MENFLKENKELLNILDNLTTLSLDLMEITKGGGEVVDEKNRKKTVDFVDSHGDGGRKRKSLKETERKIFNFIK